MYRVSARSTAGLSVFVVLFSVVLFLWPGSEATAQGPVVAPFPGAVEDPRNEIQMERPPETRASIFYTNASFEEVLDHYRAGARSIVEVEAGRQLDLIVGHHGAMPLYVSLSRHTARPDQWIIRGVDRLRDGLLASAALAGGDPTAVQQDGADPEERYAKVLRLHYPYMAGPDGDLAPASRVLFERYQAESQMDEAALAAEIQRLTMAGDREGVQRLMAQHMGGDGSSCPEHWTALLKEAETLGYRTMIRIDWQ